MTLGSTSELESDLNDEDWIQCSSSSKDHYQTCNEDGFSIKSRETKIAHSHESTPKLEPKGQLRVDAT